MAICLNCQDTIVRRLPEPRHTEWVGGLPIVDNTLEVDQCPTCGEYELTFDELGQLEVRSALTALKQGHLVGDALKYARKAIGHSRPMLASALDVTEETVFAWESNTTPINPLKLQAFLTLLENHPLYVPPSK